MEKQIQKQFETEKDCSSCFRSVCKARCYFRNGGFDFGYCEDGICKCAPPVIYVFNGVGRDLSDEYIDNSLVNDNVIQNSSVPMVLFCTNIKAVSIQ
ncbi:PREDICTED: uncharacterized protein LOC107161336 isoform X2 [Diuraphis noxia]|uniref:uncharacterized protein LOC107161336 isoform X2 n=1 Tax=Diuraphis noxia TaxID=143948 RepID=UPI0007637385|nr:PREDICTED: uncharacterized protein LOC107161336 isoform X2 [Diuraphis noxia]